MSNTSGNESTALRRVLAGLAVVAVAAGTQVVSTPPAAASCYETAHNYQFIPRVLYVADYEDPWWSPTDEITVTYPGASFSREGLANGSWFDPPDTTFKAEPGTAFRLTIVESDSGWDDDVLASVMFPVGSVALRDRWFSGTRDTSYAYRLTYEIRDLGNVPCVQYATVPFVRELSRSEADAEVRAAGLVPRFWTSPDDPGDPYDPDAWVYSVTPQEGTTVAVGSTVSMHLKTGPRL